MDKGKLEIKKVNFMGDELVAIRENDSGKIYAGVRWLCDGLALTENQRIHQTTKIHGDRVLSKGVRKILLPTKGGEQEVVCLELKMVTLWLAKINANVVKDIETQEKLVEYQLHAADVLADEFLPHNLIQQATKDIIAQIPKSVSELFRMLADKTEENDELKPKAQAFDKFIEATNVQTWLQVAKVLGTGRTRLCKLLRQQEILMSDNVPYQQYIDRGYFVTKEITAYDGITAFNYTQTLVTAKGIDFIFKLLNEINVIAKAN
jgi:phage antirepressor YoqD-like protein